MPRLSLQIQADPDAGELPAERRRMRRWVAAALERDAELVLRFVGAAEGRELNRRYRGHDRPTNVLTFPYENEPVIRADIVVCLPVVQAEALAQRKQSGDHLAHLVVHGVLHAQGHDHEDEPQASRMEARETAILRRFGISDPYA
jgi:probable rRNA maturation factor